MGLSLTLDATGGPAMEPGRVTFQEKGGTIGRDPGLGGWRLPFEYKQVSREHARITCDGRTFFLENLSQNGTTLNGEAMAARKYPLSTGDRIGIDVFEITVAISAASEPRPSRPSVTLPKEWPDDESSSWLPRQKDAVESRAPVRAPEPEPPLLHERPFVLPPEPVHNEPPGDESLSDWPKAESEVEFSTNWNPLDPLPPDPPPVRPVAPVSPPAVVKPVEAVSRPVAPRRPPGKSEVPAGGAIGLEDVLRGVGLDPSLATPELARQLGQILLIVTQGTMDVLASRQDIKGEIGAEQTMYNRRGENNPLQFSQDARHALQIMFGERSAMYLDGAGAFDDAFDDIREHQFAVVQAMRVAFETMLDKFNPARLQDDFDRQSKENALLPLVKPRYWDLYVARFHDIFSDADAAYRHFRDVFGRAYQAELANLKGNSRSKSS